MKPCQELSLTSRISDERRIKYCQFLPSMQSMLVPRACQQHFVPRKHSVSIWWKRFFHSLARSLDRVPPGERFVISELKKVRRLPWNGRAENLKATIVTQQDQVPSGHRRVYLTTKVVARHGATPGCSGCVGLAPHTEACRVRLEKALADERADLVEAPVGPILEPATESQESAPAAQQEPASSSSGPAAPMPTQHFQNEQMDSPMELGPQERRERKGARPSETPTSEISGRPVVKARPASSPMIVPTAEGSGTVVLSTPASSSKDEMTNGGLYVQLSSQRRMCGTLGQQKRAPPKH